MLNILLKSVFRHPVALGTHKWGHSFAKDPSLVFSDYFNKNFCQDVVLEVAWGLLYMLKYFSTRPQSKTNKCFLKYKEFCDFSQYPPHPLPPSIIWLNLATNVQKWTENRKKKKEKGYHQFYIPKRSCSHLPLCTRHWPRCPLW